MAAAEAGRQFDLGNLRSPGERILLELGCTLLSQVRRRAAVRDALGRQCVPSLRFTPSLQGMLLWQPCTLNSSPVPHSLLWPLQGALVREPGRLLLTDQRLYFQPLHPISGDAAVSSHPLAAVAAAARRRSSLRDVALEVREGGRHSAV